MQTLQQRGDDLSPAQRDALLGVIASEADRLAELVDDVFDTARIDADSFSYSFAELDVGELVEEAVAAAAAARRGRRSCAHVRAGLPRGAAATARGCGRCSRT